MADFAESVVEEAALAWLESLVYAINAILVVARERIHLKRQANLI
jgi:hypothetical protein